MHKFLESGWGLDENAAIRIVRHFQERPRTTSTSFIECDLYSHRLVLLQPKLKGIMKTTAEALMNASSMVRKIEFLGHKPLPYRMKHQEAYHYEGR